MATNRQVKTPGAAPEPTADETKTTDEVKTTDQQSDATQPDANQTADSSTESNQESTVDQVALIEQLQKQLAAAENKTKSLEGQLRRTTSANTGDVAKATAEVPTDGKPYLSAKGWTRG